MSEFIAFFQLGLRHITDPNGLDHVLFLLVLAAVYRLREWRALLAVATAFTVGHSITLALTVAGVVSLPSEVIEFLIPVTIVATGLENLLVRDGEHAPLRRRYRPGFAAAFGLVHGAGFANYLRSLFVEDLAVPLLGFNLGIEAGQILVVGIAGVLFLILDQGVERLRMPARAPSALQLRVLAVSTAVMVVAGAWAWERSPW